jgi:hypothetical protein
MSTTWKRAEEIVWEELDGGALLVHPASGRRWKLNGAAAAVWRHCDGLQKFCCEFEAFCNQLSAIGLLRTEHGAIEQRESIVTIQIATSSLPAIKVLGLGIGPHRRPSPRGNSGPG